VPSLGSLDTPEYQAVAFCWFLTLNKNQHFFEQGATMTLDQAVDIMEQYAEHMSGDSLTCLEHMVLNMHSLTQPQIEALDVFMAESRRMCA
jgi:hypothetical protein